MALTNDDLQAIQVVVQTTVQPMLNGLEDAFTSSIDEAVDALAQSTAAGFAEVHEKLAEHDHRFSRSINASNE